MKSTHSLNTCPQRRGFSLLEVMIALVLLSVVGLGAGIGLQAVAKIPSQTDNRLAIHNEVVSRLESMRGTAFSALVAQALALSGNVTIANNTYPCTVTVAPAAPDSTNGIQATFVQITVTIGPQFATTYVTQ